jgi:hypothetical protein
VGSFGLNLRQSSDLELEEMEVKEIERESEDCMILM